MPIIKPGQLATGPYSISGSFSGSFSGALDGTSSFAVTASHALNSGGTTVIANPGGSGPALDTISIEGTVFEISGSAGGGSGLIHAIVSGSVTASVDVQDTIFLIKSGSSTFFTIDKEGSTTISGSAENLLLIKNKNNTNVLNVSQSGVVVLSTQSAELTTTAPNGGIYFTSTSFFVGLE